MSTSKYLPPFTPEERGAAPGNRARHAVEPPAVVSDGEITYADFLGDEVED
ncbi:MULTISPECIES: hypothetical protein [unclassified Curtobacterium]|uniref:hypothetical protein n=1 Tax=unclassified Curtobacterium TaxID=257496 RepID=UPI00034CB4E7|nr:MULTISPECIES: hypothetical protein [unclassified Curtobacterium]